MIARRTVLANPRFAAAHPSRATPDLEVEGADAALVYTADDDTTVVLLTAQGAANVAEVALRYLLKAGHEDVVIKVLEQVGLEAHGGDKPALVVPKNTIRQAIMLPPRAKG